MAELPPLQHPDVLVMCGTCLRFVKRVYAHDAEEAGRGRGTCPDCVTAASVAARQPRKPVAPTVRVLPNPKPAPLPLEALHYLEQQRSK